MPNGARRNGPRKERVESVYNCQCLSHLVNLSSYILNLPTEANQRSATGIQVLRSGEGNREQREGRADDFKAGIWHK
jgi:hypothetical protein